MEEYQVVDGVGIISEDVTEIEAGAFDGCDSLTSIEIPSSVTIIGDQAFVNCTSLTSVIIPESVTEIGDNAFECCTSLTSIVIPESVTELGCGVFACCESLKSIVIKGKINAIRDALFSNCSALESITLPEGICRIAVDEWSDDGTAFDGCKSLKVINVPFKQKDYYIQRLPQEFHSLIVEMEPVKKALWVIRKTFTVDYFSEGIEAETLEEAKKMYYDGEYEMRCDGPYAEIKDHVILEEVRIEGDDDENSDIFESIKPSDDELYQWFHKDSY